MVEQCFLPKYDSQAQVRGQDRLPSGVRVVVEANGAVGNFRAGNLCSFRTFDPDVELEQSNVQCLNRGITDNHSAAVPGWLVSGVY